MLPASDDFSRSNEFAKSSRSMWEIFTTPWMFRIKLGCQTIILSAIFIIIDRRKNIRDVFHMISSAQIRAARALLAIDQRKLAELSDLSVPTIQRMEASEEVVRGNVDSLMKLIAALDAAGIELIGPGATSAAGGRGVRFKS
jgi:DNA-binding transcriptional regulator YiaG